MQANRLKLLQQASYIHDTIHYLLLELYISDGHTVPEPQQPIEIDSEEVYELK
jgi:hypothetical protein